MVHSTDAVTVRHGQVIRIRAGLGTELVKVESVSHAGARRDIGVIEVRRMGDRGTRVWINDTQVLGVQS